MKFFVCDQDDRRQAGGHGDPPLRMEEDSRNGQGESGKRADTEIRPYEMEGNSGSDLGEALKTGDQRSLLRRLRGL